MRGWGRRLQRLHEFWFGATGDPLLLLDAAGNVVGVNPAAERLLGHRGMELTGRPVASFLAPGCGALAVLREVLATGAEVPRPRRVHVQPAGGWETDADLRVRRDTGLGGGTEYWAHFKVRAEPEKP